MNIVIIYFINSNINMNRSKEPSDNNIEGMTCFSAHLKYGATCDKNSCRNWINAPNYFNCTLIAATDGRKTLQEIGDIFNITRMRVCQIEKSILRKLQSEIVDEDLVHSTKH